MTAPSIRVFVPRQPRRVTGVLLPRGTRGPVQELNPAGTETELERSCRRPRMPAREARTRERDMAEGSYNQFCPVAMAAEILCTRWTVVLLRELVAGSTRFNELRRGV